MARGPNGAVLVTGASTGIGRATALELVRRGHRVFAGVRKRADGEALKEAAEGELVPVNLDVAKERSIAAARRKVQRAVGGDGLQALVNNAGVADAGPIEHVPVEDFRSVIEVNLVGQYAVTQAFLPLIRRGAGRVVFLSSIGGLVASPFMAAYSASKFGVEALADSLRREVRPWGIDVVVVEPGSIATPIWERGARTVDSRKPSREATRMYGKQVEAMREGLIATGESGIEPDRVAKVIVRALRARRPRTRYLVGADAKWGRRLSRITSDRLFDRMIRRSYALPDDAPPAR
ncbi:MAG: SDR family oxidoreductase [Solirubrobacterales bacterium]